MADSPAPETPRTPDDAPADDAQGAAPGRTESRPVPPAEVLERLAVDVRVRRRPRYGVFIVLGILVAGVAALVWAMSVPQSAHANWGSTIWVTVLGAMGFGALIGAGASVFADWLSRRK